MMIKGYLFLLSFAAMVGIYGCKTSRTGEASTELASNSKKIDSSENEPAEKYDRSPLLAELKDIDSVLVKGAKESQSPFGQIILVSMEKQIHDFEAHVPFDLTQAQKVELQLKLECPPGGHCEAWDRLGTIMVEHNVVGQQKTLIEILRFMTPYGEGGLWSLDVTDYAAYLSGRFRVRTFIQSWSRLQGNPPVGWAMIMGLKVSGKRAPSELRPTLVWPLITFAGVPYGDPKEPAIRYGQGALGLAGVYKKAILKTIVTGHGQFNAENCAEFCQKKHTFKIGSESYFPRVWRDNCDTSVSKTQKGSYTYSRAGWCPGDIVRSEDFDVTRAVSVQKQAAAYFPEPYINTCRPGASPCQGCMSGSSCKYDDMHTPPYWLVSGNLVYYR